MPDIEQIIADMRRDIDNLRRLDSSGVVAAHYSTNAGQIIATATTTIVDFEDVLYDTHSRVTTGAAWKFTAAIAGYYHISAAIMFDATTAWAATEYASMIVFKNNAGYRYIDRENDHTSANIYVMLSGSVDVYLAATDYIDIRVTQASGGNLALLNNGTYNHVSIHRIS